MSKRKIVSYTLVIIWMFVIFMFSAQNAAESSELSYNFSNFILKPIQPFIENFNRYTIHSVIRQLSHFAIYFVLGLLLVFAVSNDLSNKYKIVLITVSIAFMYAVSDEFHQYFVPGRAFELFDILIDTLGSFIGILLTVRLLKSRWQNAEH